MTSTMLLDHRQHLYERGFIAPDPVAPPHTICLDHLGIPHSRAVGPYLEVLTMREPESNHRIRRMPVAPVGRHFVVLEVILARIASHDIQQLYVWISEVPVMYQILGYVLDITIRTRDQNRQPEDRQLEVPLEHVLGIHVRQRCVPHLAYKLKNLKPLFDYQNLGIRLRETEVDFLHHR